MSLRYFNAGEFACSHCAKNLISPDLLTELDELRHICGFPFVISSGYRCPDHNARVSSTGRNGPHTTGLAADIAVSHENAVTILEHALQNQAFTGIGVQQKGSGRFIHLDMVARPTRTIWSY